jgi:2-hydroxychromene-2-carboxylate isomerase
MREQLKRPGGASESDPNVVVRWVTSKLMSRLFSPQRMDAKREKAESLRKKASERHRIEYFHQLEDGYSHLAAQALKPLIERYDVELICHLVKGPEGTSEDNNVPEPDLLLRLSRYDASHVASAYGLEFPQHEAPLSPEMVGRASAILAAQDSKGFVACVADVSKAMWSGDVAALEQLADQYGTVSLGDAKKKLQEGTQRRAKLKHYSGAMFYYGDEWYWGVDRLYHLEKRLASLGADRTPAKGFWGKDGLYHLDRRLKSIVLDPNPGNLLFYRPSLQAGPLKDTGSLTLEVFPSLRSPYTAISFDRAVKLARDTGVKLVVRPVLPMVMRGVPATREKGMYIFMDAAREALAAGVPYGNFSDPIGEPVRRAYSLYPWAEAQGLGAEFISSFLSCAFKQGVNTNRESGLKKVVQQAGLDWNIAKGLLGRPGWQGVLEENRQAMYEAGLWGVPSFRLLDRNGEQVLTLWGQDRLWLFAREIQRLLTSR